MLWPEHLFLEKVFTPFGATSSIFINTASLCCVVVIVQECWNRSFHALTSLCTYIIYSENCTSINVLRRLQHKTVSQRDRTLQPFASLFALSADKTFATTFQPAEWDWDKEPFCINQIPCCDVRHKKGHLVSDLIWKIRLIFTSCLKPRPHKFLTFSL